MRNWRVNANKRSVQRRIGKIFVCVPAILKPKPLFPLLSSKSMTVSMTGFLLFMVKFTVDPALKTKVYFKMI